MSSVDEAFDVTSIIHSFRELDIHQRGFIRRSSLLKILEGSGCARASELLGEWRKSLVDQTIDVDEVKYEDFLRWFLMEPGQELIDTLPLRPHTPERCPSLHELAESLAEIASSASCKDAGLSDALHKHIASLRQLCVSPNVDGKPDSPISAASTAPSTVASVKPARTISKTNEHGLRERASSIVQRTGQPGELVDDLREVFPRDLSNETALACWRSCEGIRFYRSETVTEALRLICSAPVPGLGSTNYLDVFHTLTGSGWEHHIFLFGGLVRDILRRKVGNDIDVTFTAPAAELQLICEQHGYKCTLDGDYILIGEEHGAEYLEGMVVTHNCNTPPENSDFGMNWVFYDFVNDVIIDKTGSAVSAVIANRCEIPCARDKWDKWVGIGGSRVLFRYYKFLVRGYKYDEAEMSYIAGKLLDLWSSNDEQTISNGREVLAPLFASGDMQKIERLRELVFTSFELAATDQTPCHQLDRPSTSPFEVGRTRPIASSTRFLSAGAWWQKGWKRIQAME